MIRLIKIAKYELRPLGLDTYDYLRGVGLQTIDPPTLEPHVLAFPGSVVFHSPLRRAVESVDPVVSERYEVLSELAEVPFDLAQLCDRKTWKREGSVAVRRGFKAAFIADTLPVRRSVLGEEFERALARLRALQKKESDAVAVSHSFRLKLLEAYVRTEGRVVAEPELIHHFLHDDRKTFEFRRGFTLSPTGRGVVPDAELGP